MRGVENAAPRHDRTRSSNPARSSEESGANRIDPARDRLVLDCSSRLCPFLGRTNFRGAARQEAAISLQTAVKL
jgi:hypothetical protein